MLERIQELKLAQMERLREQFGGSRGAAATSRFDPARLRGGQLQVIAEVKKASPSRGVLCPDFDPVGLARRYQENGAALVSVLTEEAFFQGHPDHLAQVRQAVDIPVLRKDFIIDELQIYESLAMGADVILLIAALHDYSSLLSLCRIARQTGMEVLLEVHDRQEMDMVRDLPVNLVGINNRNLKTLQVSLATSLDLVEVMEPGWIKVSESGIKEAADMKRLEQAGFDAVLVGESLLTHADPGQKLRELLAYRGD